MKIQITMDKGKYDPNTFQRAEGIYQQYISAVALLPDESRLSILYYFKDEKKGREFIKYIGSKTKNL